MSRYKGRPKGVVLYEGKSEINGEDIVLIATFQTSNDKTGNLIQTWILPKDTNPIEAINTGKDEAVCGSCPLRGIIMNAKDSKYKGSGMHDTINRFRGCYVAVQNAPRAVWTAYKVGKYPQYDPEVHARWIKGRGFRMGSYGEPVAVPLDVWTPVIALANQKSIPGYTHQWNNPKFSNTDWKYHVMASTHTVEETELAQSMGWRTYRVRKPDQPLLPSEAECPASEAGGFQHTCESCGACDGARRGNDKQKSSMSIIAHGGQSKLTAALKVIDSVPLKEVA